MLKDINGITKRLSISDDIFSSEFVTALESCDSLEAIKVLLDKTFVAFIAKIFRISNEAINPDFVINRLQHISLARLLRLKTDAPEPKAEVASSDSDE